MEPGADRITICFIGAGNVAAHLAPALARVADVRQIVSRHLSSSGAIAAAIPSCQAADSLSALIPDAHIYIIAANDDAIAQIAAATPDYPGLWVHTSGSVGMEVFKGLKSRYGSLYPLQTFSRSIPVDLSRVPFLLEASDSAGIELMQKLLSPISSNVRQVDSRKRAALHVAAVFACNFANQMWADADRLLRREGLDISYMIPLLEATLGKLSSTSPDEAMTGPARRGDMKVISRHLDSLDPDLRNVYATVTRQILDTHHPGLSAELPE